MDASYTRFEPAMMVTLPTRQQGQRGWMADVESIARIQAGCPGSIIVGAMTSTAKMSTQGADSTVSRIRRL